MASLLSENLLNLENNTNYEGDEKMIVENCINYIKNAEKGILDLREQVTNFYVEIMASPESVNKKIDEHKENFEKMLSEFNGTYNMLISTNKNAINVQTICERNLSALQAEENASKDRVQKTKAILCEKEKDLEAATQEYERNVKTLKKDYWLNLGFKIIFALFVIAIIHFVILGYFPNFYIPILSPIVITISIILFCCCPFCFICAITPFITCFEQRDDRKAKRRTKKNVEKVNEMTERLKTKQEKTENDLEKISEICINQSNKIKIFAELKRILCNIQIYLRKFQAPIDEANNLFSLQICPPEHFAKLAERDRQIIFKGMIKVFNKIQSIYNQYESMKLNFKSTL